MINDIIIVEDVVCSLYQDTIEKSLLGELMTSWMLLNDVSYQKKENPLDKLNPGLVHPLKIDGQVTSSLYNLIFPVILTGLDSINFVYHETVMARSFLQFPQLVSTSNNPHVDLTIPHLVCLYYVNDSDGDTILYHETIDTIDNTNLPNTSFTIKKTIRPKKGTMILFNGKYYHSSSNPTSNLRCVVNFNVI